MNMCKGLEDWIAEEREAGRREGYVIGFIEGYIEGCIQRYVEAQKEIEELKAQIEAVRAETRELQRLAEEAGIQLDEHEEAAQCGSSQTAE